MIVAALYVETDGAYAGLPHIDPWDIGRDAKRYAGPHPVVAHPPCQRWGRFWHGSTRKPHQFELGADEGCFAAALANSIMVKLRAECPSGFAPSDRDTATSQGK